MIAADRLLDELDLSKDEPVDVFGAITQLQLELAIVPLDGLLGAMLPHGNGGILVTTERNPRLQRYTAAHEIGHWALHRVDLAVDTETEILRTTTGQERQAQLFAAYFLMPPPLVEAVLTRYDLRGQQITAEHVYLASRDMQVSYEAAALRFYAARLITSAELAVLNDMDRLDALRKHFGRRPENGHADLWQQQYSPVPERIEISENDEVVIELPENRASGWRWLDDAQVRRRSDRAAVERPRPRPRPPSVGELATTARPDPASSSPAISLSAALYDADYVRVVADAFVPPHSLVGPDDLARAGHERAMSQVVEPEGLAVGGTGQRSIVLRGDTPGEATFHLQYAHAYDPAVTPALTYQVTVEVKPSPTTAYRRYRVNSAELGLVEDDPDDDTEYPVAVS